jgi:methylthioribose-1-phosphate isomerase
MPDDRTGFPAEKLHAAIPDDPETRKHIDALHRELASDRPTAANINQHVTELKKHATLRDVVTAWFENPRTQAFIDELTATGL